MALGSCHSQVLAWHGVCLMRCACLPCLCHTTCLSQVHCYTACAGADILRTVGDVPEHARQHRQPAADQDGAAEGRGQREDQLCARAAPGQVSG